MIPPPAKNSLINLNLINLNLINLNLINLNLTNLNLINLNLTNLTLNNLTLVNLAFGLGLIINCVFSSIPALGETPPVKDLDLSPEVINNSPVLQRWRQKIPNVLEDIKNDPSFVTRVRLGYSLYPSEQTGGINLGVEDIFIDSTGLTISSEYQTTFNSKQKTYGAELRYYLRPLGNYVNIAPVVGYRSVETNSDRTSGVNVGVKLLLVLSRSGAADISLTQSWIAPNTSEEVGLTSLSFAYAIAPKIRLSTDLRQQNSPTNKDRRIGVNLEWIP